MINTIKSILLTVILLSVCGCTRNNGDIGDFFGTWRLEELTADGVPTELTNQEHLVYTWAFQSHIIYIQTILPHDAYKRARGTWVQTDNILALDFNHTDIDGDLNYTPPAELHLVADGTTRLEIKEMTHKRMHLEYTADDGVRYAYYLKKAY